MLDKFFPLCLVFHSFLSALHPPNLVPLFLRLECTPAKVLGKESNFEKMSGKSESEIY